MFTIIANGVVFIYKGPPGPEGPQGIQGNAGLPVSVYMNNVTNSAKYMKGRIMFLIYILNMKLMLQLKTKCKIISLCV